MQVFSLSLAFSLHNNLNCDSKLHMKIPTDKRGVSTCRIVKRVSDVKPFLVVWSLWTNHTLLKSLQGETEVSDTTRYSLNRRVNRGNSHVCATSTTSSTDFPHTSWVILVFLSVSPSPALCRYQNTFLRVWFPRVKKKGVFPGSFLL